MYVEAKQVTCRNNGFANRHWRLSCSIAFVRGVRYRIPAVRSTGRRRAADWARVWSLGVVIVNRGGRVTLFIVVPHTSTLKGSYTMTECLECILRLFINTYKVINGSK